MRRGKVIADIAKLEELVCKCNCAAERLVDQFQIESLKKVEKNG